MSDTVKVLLVLAVAFAVLLVITYLDSRPSRKREEPQGDLEPLPSGQVIDEEAWNRTWPGMN